MHPDFAISRGGHWKGCRCHGCGRSLKMVHIPCCVSITMVTCLRQTEQGGGERCRDVATWSLFFPVREKLTVTRVDHFPYQLGIALVKRDRISPHVCIWASFANTVWRNSRWGCRSVSLKTFFLSSSFLLSSSVSGVSWNQNETGSRPTYQVSRSRQKGPKFASLQLILWGDGEVNSNHIHTAVTEVGFLFWSEIKWNMYYVSSSIYYFHSDSLPVWYSPSHLWVTQRPVVISKLTSWDKAKGIIVSNENQDLSDPCTSHSDFTI